MTPGQRTKRRNISSAQSLAICALVKEDYDNLYPGGRSKANDKKSAKSWELLTAMFNRDNDADLELLQLTNHVDYKKGQSKKLMLAKMK